ncbi:MAG: nucleotidyltransferase family protein [Candidatus Aphodosoma sp.]
MPCAVNWKTVIELSNRQEVNAIAFDGYQAIHDTIVEGGIPKFLMMEWLGQTVSLVKQYKIQYAAAVRLAELYDLNFIRTFILKGFSIACCYPVPSHRFSCDLDCHLTARDSKQEWDAYSLGNSIIESKGIPVNSDYYKHSEFTYEGLHVENHRFCCSVKRGKRTKELEAFLQDLLGKGDVEYLDESKLALPPLMFQALFLLEHACAHFLYEKITLKHICDWAMFRKHYKEELDWRELDMLCIRFCLKSFVETMNHLADYLLGDVSHSQLSTLDKRVLEDTFKEVSLPSSKIRQRIRKAIDVLRSGWKFRHFNDVSMIKELSHSFFAYLMEKDVEL